MPIIQSNRHNYACFNLGINMPIIGFIQSENGRRGNAIMEKIVESEVDFEYCTDWADLAMQLTLKTPGTRATFSENFNSIRSVLNRVKETAFAIKNARAPWKSTDMSDSVRRLL